MAVEERIVQDKQMIAEMIDRLVKNGVKALMNSAATTRKWLMKLLSKWH